MTISLKDLSHWNRALIGLVVLLIALRLALPSICKTAINWTLAHKLENYEGHIDDFSLALYRGAYQIGDLKIWKKGLSPESSLLQVKELDLSLAWRAIFQHKILGDLQVDGLKLQVLDSADKQKVQNGSDENNWSSAAKVLVPISLESVLIHHSEIHFINHDFKYPVDAFIDQIDLSAYNLKNTDDHKAALPSAANLTGRLQANAELAIHGNFNFLKKIPDFNMNAEIKKFELPKLNHFFLAYGPFTFTTGQMSIYAEAANHEGDLKGYLKPFLENIRMIAPHEEFKSTRQMLTESLMGTANFILKNSKNNTLATRIDFAGPLNKPHIEIWDAVWTAVKNGFGHPLTESLDKN